MFGDSNTKHYRFGAAQSEQEPTFGVWLPGKRDTTSKIRDITDAQNIANYRNVITHAGINDFRDTLPPSAVHLVRHLEYKCSQIH